MLVCFICVGVAGNLFPQGSLFTYQGRLLSEGNSAAGIFDFTFTIFDTDTAGNVAGNTITNPSVTVTNGLFTVTLDFGTGVFTGPARWLEIAVRPGSMGAFTVLSPRQAVTAAPYAITAANLTGGVAFSQLPANVITNGASGLILSGSFAGNAASLTNQNFYLSDAALAADTNAAYYINTTGVALAEDRQSIAGFIAELKRQGVWTNLVDAGFLKTNLGASALKVTTLMGRACAVSNLQFTSWGARFTNGNSVSTFLVVSNLPDLRTNTLVAVVRGPGGAFTSITWPQNLIGVFGNQGARGERISYDNYADAVFREASTDTPSGTCYFSYFAILNSQVVDNKRRVVAAAFSGTNVTGWFDGVPCLLHATQVSPNYLVTGPLTNLWIGNTPDGTRPLTGEVDCWMVFNSVLNQAQLAAVEKAARWLEPGDQNIVFIGDSQGINSAEEIQYFSPSIYFTNGWPWQYMNSGMNAQNPCWWNECQSGTTTATWAQPAFVGYQYLTNRVALDGLGGKVKKLRIIWGGLGVNDQLQSYDGNASLNNISNLLLTCRSFGAEVWAITQNAPGTNIAATVGGGANWTTLQDTNRQMCNAFLRANPQMYDRLIDRDLLLTPQLMNDTSQPTGITRDGLHLRMAGNRLQAQFVLARETGVDLLNAVYDASGNVVSSVASGNTTILGSVSAANIFLNGSSNFLVFGATNSAPNSTAAPATWVDVSVKNDTNHYRLPLYK